MPGDQSESAVPRDLPPRDLPPALQALLDHAAELGASDIHLLPVTDVPETWSPLLRVDGSLVEGQSALQLPLGHLRELASLPDPWSAYLVPDEYLMETYPAILARSLVRRDLESSVLHLGSLRQRGRRWRVATLPGTEGARVCLHRVLDELPPLDAIGQLQGAVQAAVREASGIVIFSGPPGHGATTTFYSALLDARPRRQAILTIEEVVEASLPGVHQSELAGHRVNLGALLRGVLQQDPDVIGVGAVASEAAAALAFTAASSGAKVLATMHLNRAVSAVGRLLTMGIEPYMLVGSLRVVNNQRLVRLTCDHCAAREELSPAQRQELESRGLRADQARVGRGCEHCSGSGVAGRSAIVETLILTAALDDLILQGASSDELQQAASAAGMRTLREQALAMAASGTISVGEALQVTPR